MKTNYVALLTASLALSPGVSHAEPVWLLVPRWDHFTVVAAESRTARDVIDVRSTAPNYGESRRLVAIVSDGYLKVINKTNGALTSYPFAGNPREDVAGPLSNVLVTDDHVFFPTIRYPDRDNLNQLGGRFDITEVSLGTGAIRSLPLPADCLDAHVTAVGGTVLVYAPASDKAWTLDAERATFTRVLWPGDVADLRADEASRGARMTPRAYVTYTVVQGAGIFRLSRLGQLDQILDANLHIVNAPPAALGLAPVRDVLALMPGGLSSSPAIGAVTREPEGIVFSYIDASALDVLWTAPVQNDAIPASFHMAHDNSVYYIDKQTGAINRMSPNGETTTISQVELDQRSSSLARILSIGVEQ